MSAGLRSARQGDCGVRDVGRARRPPSKACARLASSAGYARVKAQLRVMLAHIVAHEDDPLLDGWL